MTDFEKAARLAQEAICASGDFLFNWHDCEPNNEREMQAYQAALAANETAITALRQTLEQPAKQGPVDWEAVAADQAMTIAMMKAERKPWVGLTDEEIARVVSLAGFAPDWAEANIATQIVRVCQNMLKEKNA